MDKTIGFLERLINFAGVRHRVLLSNIANSDTPGYRAKDVSFSGILKEEGVRLMKSNPRHMTVSEMEDSIEIQQRDQRTWKDQNNVELDMEVAKMTENALLYNASIRLLNTRLRMFRNAIRGMR